LMTSNLTQLLFLGSSRPSGWNHDIVYCLFINNLSKLPVSCTY